MFTSQKQSGGQNPFGTWRQRSSTSNYGSSSSSSPFSQSRNLFKEDRSSFSGTSGQGYSKSAGQNYFKRSNTFGKTGGYDNKNSYFQSNTQTDDRSSRNLFQQGTKSSSIFQSGGNRPQGSTWSHQAWNSGSNNKGVFNQGGQGSERQANSISISWSRKNNSYDGGSHFQKPQNRYSSWTEQSSNDLFRRPHSPDLYSQNNRWKSGAGGGTTSYGFRQDRSRSPSSAMKSLSFQKPSSYVTHESSQLKSRHDILDPWKLTSRDYPLPGKPSDLRKIMDIKWSPKDDLLLIPFQDGYLKGWNFDRRFGSRYGSTEVQPEAVMNIKMKHPVVSMDFVDDGCFFVYGDFYGNVFLFDLESEEISFLGSHNFGVTHVHYYPRHSLALTLGDDSVMRLYDSRQDKPAFDFKLDCGIPISSDLKKDAFIFATNTNQVVILDLDMLLKSGGKEYAAFQSPLFHKVEQVALSYDHTLLGIAGAEGRIAIRELNMRQPFDPKEMEKPTYNVQNNYTFKCHRDATKDSRKDFIRQINQLDFHPRRNDVLATCGSDGSYFLWNVRNQSLILKNRPLPNPKTPVSNIAFNKDGSLFAHVVGDDGTLGMHPDWKWGCGYFVRVLLDTDLQVRQT